MQKKTLDCGMRIADWKSAVASLRVIADLAAVARERA
jgi:hypothetical protein